MAHLQGVQRYPTGDCVGSQSYLDRGYSEASPQPKPQCPYHTWLESLRAPEWPRLYPAGSQEGLGLTSSSLPLQDKAGDSARPAGSTSRSHIGKKVPEACWETLLLDYMKTHIVEDTMKGGWSGRLPCPKLLLWGLLLSLECPGLENRRARSPK